MKEDEFVEKFREFVDGSNTFNGVTFVGCYDMGLDRFCAALKHYLKTGENKLDEHSEITYLGWDAISLESKGTSNSYPGNYMYEEDRIKAKKILSNDGFWNINAFLNMSQIEEIKKLMSISENQDEYKKTYKYRRREACAHTSNGKTRERIFARDGRTCTKCGSTENLQLDHIIPVIKGGMDNDENLQVLCRACNSSKSAKIE